ncbi:MULTISPECIES: hypothetical protein [Massilia]|uniref:DUF4412 domain-containing protein n=1 Tax=Massilia timonae TaxID=47229 RepID=A0A1S2NFK1_9BURK|nr:MULTISPECIES: hypothetical protein [Massilia]OIJ43474.1 hypothetical protein LO55_896 [Massilia timonae]QYG00910.1 hypothetical protein KY496_21475 [Massilia sp. NP310]
MNTRTILIATLLASAFAPALAEDYTIDQGSDGERRIVIRQGTVTLPPGQQAAQRAGDSASLAASMLRISGAGIVKNAPYSAEAVSESMQRLADGNQIVNTSRSMQYRDGAGRTRTEVHGDDGEVRTITISDPVEGARWILNPQRKSATRLDMTSELARAEADAARAAATQARRAADQARERIDQLRREGKLPEGTHIIVKDVQRGAQPTEVRVRVAEPMPAARAMSAQIAPLIIGAVNDGKWSAKAVTRELGGRDFSGLRAEGNQRSYTIPAGEIGNRAPIEVSSETWYSPELQVTVYHKRSDPRSGDVVYRLDKLKRGEPPAALFSVPSDYTVRDPLKVSSRKDGKDD